ncbi:MAG: hypothetical protein K2X52_15185, partial [Mycobacteriaceae bacterium]|nr:hypothetical protein [Mycobacteriaceae bacterium]
TSTHAQRYLTLHRSIHTIAHPTGPTQASNLKCLCRQHHLLKTFWGWADEQHPDGTIIWTCPQGQTYTTHPGSRLLFPTLCRPTAPLRVDHSTAPTAGTDITARGLAMPRRTQTRAQNRTQAINDERRHNQTLIHAEAQQHFPTRPPPPSHNDPAPF